MITGIGETREVFINGIKLDAGISQKVWNHSPDGFNWGYSGSGPAQLALALLLFFAERNIAIANYQAFKSEIIAGLPLTKDFTLDEETIKNWLNGKEGK